MLKALKLVEERGVEKGIKIGEERTTRKIVLRLLLKQFGDLEEEYVRVIENKKVEELDIILEKIIDIKEIEELEKYLY
ncbi:hypothetical protein U472_01065 [Orenia metallireducens]|uniref:DUF4351 domain-containing protein n=1 Tax=Orenia metallireducens TaxID=1413210 RepID=A0A1C0ACY4_9FIRM|nr:DUF4351 domain-containing protein [Orenia metallireducens]OCL28508.1 hypothetical protein U472_01065 [Orenia metallireducens]